jgi:hypothetical protein
MSNRPSVFAPIEVKVPAKAKAASAARVEMKPTPAAGEDEMFRTSLYLTRAVHDKLREIAFTERLKVHDLFVEGIDKVLRERGFPSAGELRNAKAS